MAKQPRHISDKAARHRVINECVEVVQGFEEEFPEAAQKIADALKGMISVRDAHKQRILDTIAQHPDWTARQVAETVGCSRSYVHYVKYGANLTLPAGKDGPQTKRKK